MIFKMINNIFVMCPAVYVRLKKKLLDRLNDWLSRSNNRRRLRNRRKRKRKNKLQF